MVEEFFWELVLGGFGSLGWVLEVGHAEQQGWALLEGLVILGSMSGSEMMRGLGGLMFFCCSLYALVAYALQYSFTLPA